MSEPVVRARNLGKCYKLYARPLDRLKELFATRGKHYHQDFWALQSVSFSVRPGSRGVLLGAMGQENRPCSS